MTVSGEVPAKSNFTSHIPNGTRNVSNARGDGCGHCHVLPASKSLNSFGSRWKRIEWGPTLAGEDSDGDDVSNGWELGDPEGKWQRGEPDPGNPALVTSPGQAESLPPVFSVNPLEIDHFETQGENLWETLTVENVGGDCFGNPTGACTLSFDVSSSEVWMTIEPDFAELSPQAEERVDILFSTGGLLGDFEGLAELSSPGVWNSPQQVLVALTVPEPSAQALNVAALLVLTALAIKPRRPRQN